MHRKNRQKEGKKKRKKKEKKKKRGKEVGKEVGKKACEQAVFSFSFFRFLLSPSTTTTVACFRMLLFSPFFIGPFARLSHGVLRAGTQREKKKQKDSHFVYSIIAAISAHLKCTGAMASPLAAACAELNGEFGVGGTASCLALPSLPPSLPPSLSCLSVTHPVPLAD